MLKCIHFYSTKRERKAAFSEYYNWRNSQKYTHITINEDGDPREIECTRYVYHVERMLDESRLHKVAGTYEAG